MIACSPSTLAKLECSHLMDRVHAAQATCTASGGSASRGEIGLLLITLLALSACSGREEQPAPQAPALQLARSASEAAAYRAPSRPSVQTVHERLDQIASEVWEWRRAPDLATGKRHAEAARNLIVGPTGPGYGDVDGDGRVSGANAIGLLPGLKGSAALAIPANACVARDLLGGSWEDPARRWALLDAKIVAWRTGNNTFPTLPSHAQRIVGWASLTLGSSDLETARGYAAHANIHVNVSRTALTRC
jgi:hypothetical protein